MELAHKYIDGLASQAEIAEIKQRLKSDKNFRKEFMRLQAMKAMLKAEEKVEMRNEMSNLFDAVVKPKLDNKANTYENSTQQQLNSKPTKVINLQRIGLAVAAAITLVLVATFALNQGMNNQAVYESYYSPYSVSTPRGTTDVNKLQTAIQNYTKGDYSLAQEQLKAYLTTLTIDQNQPDGSDNKKESKQLNMIYLMLANCALMLNDTKNAKAYLKKNLQIANGQYLHDARWYLALTHIKAGENEEAKTLLHDIASSMNIYQAEAKELLEKWDTTE